MKLHITLILLLGFSLSLFAQGPVGTDLPRFATEQELLAAPATPDFNLQPFTGFAGPPSGPIRTMAEWEELQALVITWQAGNDDLRNILTEIVRNGRLECKVVICCANQSTKTTATNYLVSKGVDLSTNVDFVIVPNNSIWVRDYGPNPVYKNDVDSLFFIDWKYNRTTRPKDDSICTTLSPYFNIPLYRTLLTPEDLVNTGGNFMSDGQGSAFASSLILDENAAGNPYGASVKTEAQINEIFQDYMGIQRYIKMDPLPYDVIHHIDMHMKLLDEETLLVGQYPAGEADGPQIEANIQYVLSNFSSAFGTPYKVIRIPMPPDADQNFPDANGDYRTYANAVFVNKTVILPFYEQKYDTTAQRIWESALPGYKIVGINCNAIIPSLGAIHCITKEVGVKDPLLIVHQELACQNNMQVSSYPVYAKIQHRSGIASAKVYYALSSTGPWETVDMTHDPLNSTSLWQANIPQQPAGGNVYYYIEATANDGKVLNRPMPAPQGFWSFCVDSFVASTEPEQISLSAVYPNPAAAITCVPVVSNQESKANIELLNALGQSVYTIYSGMIPAGSSNYFFDASRFAPGAYMIQFKAAQN